MSKRPISWFILIFTLLEAVVKTHLTVYDSSHGFMPNSHDRYIIEDISSMHEELPADIRSSSINNLKLNLRFEPEFLDFKQRPLGVPHVEKVRLINTDSNRSIDMTSISGSTVHFHSSFFEDKKIPPLGNTTFNVVFLGREEGSIESNLFIHTTEGHLKYQVRGASIYSPYRLRPIVGVKLPINTSFSPLIYMHNPHTEPIQIVEVYSSGGDFHLELPSGELEGPKDLWEIPPLETKAVIRVRFHARTEQNHTAYVRIKLNNTEEILVVPLEVEVTSTAGLFVPQGSIDFGVGASLDPPKQVKLYLQNPLKKHVKIHSITSTSKAIKISFENIKVPFDSKGLKNEPNPVEVATLTLDCE